MAHEELKVSSQESGSQRFRRKAVVILHFLLWFVLSAQTALYLVPLVDSPSFGISVSGTKRGPVLEVGDLPFIVKFVQKAWLRETTVNSGASIYSVANHLKVTTDWAGQQVTRALPFAYSPTMLVIMAPLVPLPNDIAYLIFNGAGLLAVFWMTRPNRCRLGIGLLPFFSRLARFCFVLGQTALLTGVGLLFVAEKTLRDRVQAWRDTLTAGCVLWALTAKPPIALSAVAVLIGRRQWRTLLVAGVLTIFSMLLIWPLLGAHWATDYIHLIGSYNRIDADPAFIPALVPGIMGNLRAILNVDIGLRDDLSSLVSATTWFVMLGYITLAGLRSRLPASVLWCMSILSYLLFCPHVTATEELQVVIILVLGVSLRDKLTKLELFLLVTVPLLAFISPVSRLFWGKRLPLFLSQMILLSFLAFRGKDLNQIAKDSS